MNTYNFKNELERTFEITEVLKGLGNNVRTTSKAAARLLRRLKKI